MNSDLQAAQIFIEAANEIADADAYSCNEVGAQARALFPNQGTDAISERWDFGQTYRDRYSAIFAPDVPNVYGAWLNGVTDDTGVGYGIPYGDSQDCRVLMLCLASAMALTGDI